MILAYCGLTCAGKKKFSLRSSEKANGIPEQHIGEFKMENKDLEQALNAVQKRTATAIGAPQVDLPLW